MADASSAAGQVVALSNQKRLRNEVRESRALTVPLGVRSWCVAGRVPAPANDASVVWGDGQKAVL